MKRMLWAAVAAALLAPGCKQVEPSTAHKPWWRRVLNAPNEMYFDERSRDIEENLQRTNNVTIDG